MNIFISCNKKIFKFSLALRPLENIDVCIALDENISGIHSKCPLFTLQCSCNILELRTLYVCMICDEGSIITRVSHVANRKQISIEVPRKGHNHRTRSSQGNG